MYVLSVLNSCEFDDSCKIVTDYKAILKEKISDQKKLISAYQFGAYITKEVEKVGKEAMNTELGFSEIELLNENLDLIKTLTKASSIKVVPFTEETKLKGHKNAPIPGKPIFYCD